MLKEGRLGTGSAYRARSEGALGLSLNGEDFSHLVSFVILCSSMWVRVQTSPPPPPAMRLDRGHQRSNGKCIDLVPGAAFRGVVDHPQHRDVHSIQAFRCDGEAEYGEAIKRIACKAPWQRTVRLVVLTDSPVSPVSPVANADVN